jgi:hypothetical protein
MQICCVELRRWTSSGPALDNNATETLGVSSRHVGGCDVCKKFQVAALSSRDRWCSTG